MITLHPLDLISFIKYLIGLRASSSSSLGVFLSNKAFFSCGSEEQLHSYQLSISRDFMTFYFYFPYHFNVVVDVVTVKCIEPRLIQPALIF